MLTEKEINILNRCMDEKIVNEDIIKNKDRDITDVVFDVLCKYRFGHLVAYTYEMADLSTMYKADFNGYLYKLTENKKGTKQKNITIDVTDITDAYMMLRMKFIAKPEFVSDKFKYTAYENTINEFEENIVGYENVRWEVLDLIKEEFRREIEKEKDPLVKIIGTDKEYTCNLFCEEQTLLIPIIDKSNKYILNGISYYGAYNNTLNERMTTGGEYSIKTYRDSVHTMLAILIGSNENGIYIRYFGKYINAFIFLSSGNIKKMKPDDIIPFSDNDTINDLLMKTWENALNLYEEHLVDDSVDIYDEYRLKLGEDEFKKKMVDSIYKYIYYSNGILVEERGLRTFEQIGTLEEELFSLFNGGDSKRRSTTRKQDPSVVVKRINIKPLSLISLIKRGNVGNNSPNRVFISTTTEPNPLDIFNMFLFIKKTPHNASGNAKLTKGNTNQREDEQLINMEDMRYLGQFAPKSNKHLGSTTQLHFNIKSDKIIRRSKE